MTKLTRQHFQAIAKALKTSKLDRNLYCPDSDADDQFRLSVKYVAFTLAMFNPQFDLDKFYEACGLTE